MGTLFTYTSIDTTSEGVYADKGSKFIGYAYPINSEEEFKNHLKNLKSKHAGARHFCSAFRLGKTIITDRSNDDGEPSGTGGKPILNQLISAGLTESGIIVVRYFGGTLLGTSGLIQAYKGAAKAALENATIVEKEITISKEISIPYPVYNDFMYLIKKHGIKAESIQSSDKETCFAIEIPLRIREKLLEELKTIIGI